MYGDDVIIPDEIPDGIDDGFIVPEAIDDDSDPQEYPSFEEYMFSEDDPDYSIENFFNGNLTIDLYDMKTNILLETAGWYWNNFRKVPSSWELVEQVIVDGLNKGIPEYIYRYARLHYLYLNDEEYLALISTAAEQNCPEAQVAMGMRHYDCTEPEESIEWFRRAAAQGNAAGQRLYAEHLLKKCMDWEKNALLEGKREVFDEALSLLESASAVDAKAQYTLGMFYSNGVRDVIGKDKARAFELFAKSSEQYNYLASLECGIALEEGKGVPKDLEKAGEYYLKAQYECARFQDGYINPEVEARLQCLIDMGVIEDPDDE